MRKTLAILILGSMALGGVACDGDTGSKALAKALRSEATLSADLIATRARLAAKDAELALVKRALEKCGR